MTMDSTALMQEPTPDSSPLLEGEKAPKRASRGKLIVMRLRAMPRFWFGLVVVALLILWAVLAPMFSKYGLEDTDLLNSGTGPSGDHWFGTDSIGHDIYVQTALGLRKSLVIGLIAGPMTTVISAFFGSIAGYLGGKFDVVITWLINLLLVIPGFFIIILVMPMFKGAGWVALLVLVPVFGWMIVAQTVRAQTMSLKDRDFVKAARFMGVSTPKILVRHIVPNLSSLLIVDATINVNYAVSTETALSYFGFGIQPPDVSIGSLLQAGTPSATTQPWLFLFPAVVLITLLLAVSLLGDSLRDAIDPTSGVNRD